MPKILELIEDPSHFLSTIQIGVTLAGFLTSASAASSFSEPLAAQFLEWFPALTKAADVVNGAAMVLVTVVISYFSLVLGELAPKRIGMQASEKISFAVVGPLLFIKKVMKPFIKVLSASTNGVVRLLGFNPKGGDESLTKEEIRMLVDEGEEKGVIDEDQREMIHNIFDFTDVPVREVMTHRTEQAEAISLGENVYEFDGGLEVREAEELLGVMLPEGEYDTIGGFIMDALGHVPSEAECVEVSSVGYRFVVARMKERRICRVRAEQINSQG